MHAVLTGIDWTAGFIAVVSAGVIVVGVAHALMRLTGWIVVHVSAQHAAADSPSRHLLGVRAGPRSDEVQDFRSIGVGLSRSLVLGLQLLLAAEVVHTVALVESATLTKAAASPRDLWNGVGIIAATAVLRVFLTEFLGLEIRRVERGQRAE
ncbi:MAG TPA: DUF1622 domain-containing protein [Acidimicrobiales bacterium]|nr:DUF1622 domain-containing protein [Acidimicrobiales bacterium]